MKEADVKTDALVKKSADFAQKKLNHSIIRM